MSALHSGTGRLTIVLTILATLLAIAGTGVAVVADAGSGAVESAIARAVGERIGGDPRVNVTRVQVGLLRETDGITEASPEPGARTGQAARFVLFAGGVRVGSVAATVGVTARHVRARRALARGEELTAADIEEVDGPLVDQPIRRVPVMADVIGTRVKRNVVAGEAITAAVVEVPPVVKSGDVVAVTVRVGAVEAEGRGVASGSGHVGDIIRVVPPGTRRPLKARIVAPGRVEIEQ